MNVLFPGLYHRDWYCRARVRQAAGRDGGGLLGVVSLRLLNIPLTDVSDTAHSRPARGDWLLHRRIGEGDLVNRGRRAGRRSDCVCLSSILNIGSQLVCIFAVVGGVVGR